MRSITILLSFTVAACSGGTAGKGTPDGGASGGGTSSAWAGTWTIVIGTYHDTQSSTASPTGKQGILAMGQSIDWTDFANPAIPACNLTATPVQTVLDLSSLSCNGYLFAPGSQALFSDYTTGPQINVTATGTEPSGGSFQLTMRLQH